MTRLLTNFTSGADSASSRLTSIGLAALAVALLVSLERSAVADKTSLIEEHDARVAIGIDDGNYWDETALTSYAQILASRPFRERPPLPNAFSALTYDSYRKIVFDPAKTLWRDTDEPFQLELYHRGYIYPEQVKLFVIEPPEGDGFGGRRISAIPFDRSYFTYRGDASGLLHDPEYGTAKGYAGFKLIGHQPSSEWMQEFFSFIGSSYFRGLADTQVYGTSCRALAVNIGMNDEEEFPAFRGFWLEKPTSPDDTTFVVHALLDSESVSGAYRFHVTPGNDLIVDVSARLFFRRVPEKVGFAPLSSMWMWGKGLKGPVDDKRPEVHDADGLLVHADSAWMWRPLTRQPYPSVSGMNAGRIQGFGLMQRGRDKETYNDDEARYVDRPSVWIEPVAGWTPGRVELLEFPTRFEGMDNIAAWYVPFGLFPGGKADPMRPVSYSYRITISGRDPDNLTLAKTTDFQISREDGRDRQLVVIGEETIEQGAESLDPDDPKGQAIAGDATGQASGASGDDNESNPANATPKKVRVTIDFSGSSLEGVEMSRIKPQVDGIRVLPTDVQVSRPDGDDGKPLAETVRVSFTAVPETTFAFELRATLLGTFPTRSDNDSAQSQPEGRESETNSSTATGRTITRPLTETWSYLCPPTP